MIRKLFYILALFLLITPNAWATTYYVAETGAGDEDGSSYANRMGVAAHNNGDLGAGANDTVYLCDAFDDSSSSRVIIPHDGDVNNDITYRGDYPDHAGVINFSTSGYVSLSASDRSYVTIQSITIYNGHIGIAVSRTKNVTVKKCTIYEMDQTGIKGTADIEDLVIGGASGDGNTIYNIGDGTDGADILIQGANGVVISYNKCYADNVGWGIDGITIKYCSDVTIEYNEVYDHQRTGNGEDGIDFKQLNTNCICRFNHVYGNRRVGIYVQMGSTGIDVYGNSVHDNEFDGINIKQGEYAADECQVMSDINVWGNLLYSNQGCGAVVQLSSTYCDSYDIDDVQFTNNVFAYNGGYLQTRGGGLTIQDGNDHIVKNNIFLNNTDDVNDSIPYQQVEISGSDTTVTFDDNVYHNTNCTGDCDADDDMFTVDTTDYNITEWNALNGGGSGVPVVADDISDDPEMTDPLNNDDFTLGNSSPCIDTGTNIGASYDDALHPVTTDFTTSPPTVATADQDEWGAAWEIGAFAFPTSGVTVTVTATDATAEELNQTTGTWTIACSPNCTGETINYSFSGTAVLNTDYDCDDEDGSIVINGASTTITLTPVDDSDYDPSETAILTIDVGTGYAVGSPSSGSISIVDDDSAPTGTAQGQMNISSSGTGSMSIIKLEDCSGCGSYTR